MAARLHLVIKLTLWGERSKICGVYGEKNTLTSEETIHTEVWWNQHFISPGVFIGSGPVSHFLLAYLLCDDTEVFKWLRSTGGTFLIIIEGVRPKLVCTSRCPVDTLTNAGSTSCSTTRRHGGHT